MNPEALDMFGRSQALAGAFNLAIREQGLVNEGKVSVPIILGAAGMVGACYLSTLSPETKLRVAKDWLETVINGLDIPLRVETVS